MGFLSGLFGDGGAGEIKKGKRKADAALREGYEGAKTQLTGAADLFTPYVEEGRAASERYNALLGLGSDEDRTAGYESYASDPGFQGMLGIESNRLLKQLNARGQTYGGTSALAGARVGAENYGNYLNRLQDRANAGFTATTGRSGALTNLGNLDFGYGATRAGQEINTANALAQAEQSGINNLFNAVGTAAKVGSMFMSDARLKRDLTKVGEMASGLPVYRFRYHWSPEVYEGVLAQEAIEKFPDSVFRHESGYLAVDYAKVS